MHQESSNLIQGMNYVFQGGGVCFLILKMCMQVLEVVGY